MGHAFAVSPRMEITTLRNSFLDDLKQRGTPEALIALEKIAAESPELEDRLHWILIEARENVRRHTWRPPTPATLLNSLKQNIPETKLAVTAFDAEIYRRRQEAPVKPTANPNKRFLVALSFPGEYRSFIEKVAHLLSQELGKQRVLYDKFHEAEFARPNLDTHLQALYHNESELLVVFLCAEYERKEWTGLEWRAIRDLIKQKQDTSIMFIRLDEANIPGLFSIDGYISAQGREPAEIATLIFSRLQSLQRERQFETTPIGNLPPSETSPTEDLNKK